MLSNTYFWQHSFCFSLSMKYHWFYFLFSLFLPFCLQGCLFDKRDTSGNNIHIPSSQDTYISEIAGRTDSLLNYLHTSRNFNGNILVVHNGLKILQKSYGYADFRSKTILTSNSSFRISSMSKQFTAMAIMLLKEAGKLTYNDTIKQYFRSFPYPDITIRHLLNHTSGLPNYGEYFAKVVLTSKYKFTYPVNQDILLWLINEKPKLYFKTGESWLYTNTGYVLLALIVEKISRKPFAQYLQEHIFSPLEMNNTLVFDNRSDVANRVYGFKNNKKFYDDHLFKKIYGDGGIYSSTADLYKWDQALRTERLVTKNTLKEAFSPTSYFNNMFKKNYGFGWHLDKTGQTAQHSGSSGGFRSIIIRGLDRDNCVVLLSNNQDGRFENIAKVIFGWLDE